MSALEAADTRAGFLVCVVFLVEHDGRLLLLRRSAAKDHAPGEWESGSGGILPGETPQAAVLREAKEETGLDVAVVDVIDAFHFYRGAERRETIGITFHCRAAHRDVALSEEHDEARWVTFAELAAGPYPEWLRRAGTIIAQRRRPA